MRPANPRKIVPLLAANLAILLAAGCASPSALSVADSGARVGPVADSPEPPLLTTRHGFCVAASVSAADQSGRTTFTVTVENQTDRDVRVHPLYAQPDSIQLFIRKVGVDAEIEAIYPWSSALSYPPPTDLPAKSELSFELHGYPEEPGVYDCYFIVTLHELDTEPPALLKTNTLRVNIPD